MHHDSTSAVTNGGLIEARSDVTAIWTLTGWMYLGAILDLFSRPVVVWSPQPASLPLRRKGDGALAVGSLAEHDAIGDYIDDFCNVEWQHSSLDGLNPIEFELRSQFQQGVA